MIVNARRILAARAVRNRFGKGFPSDLVRRTRTKLATLDEAEELEELRDPPGNHPDALGGDRAGRQSVRINGQRRIRFAGIEDGPEMSKSFTAIRRRFACRFTGGYGMGRMTNPSHPGEVLDELYLKPLGMSATALAKRLDVPRARIARLLKCQTSILVDTAMRLARFFSTTPEIWMNIQRAWDLAEAGKSIDVSAIVPLRTEHASVVSSRDHMAERTQASE